MGRSKLERFKVNSERYNVIEPGKELFENIKGKWRQYFKNDNPLVLEIGCGRGEYTTGLANLFSDRNYIGIDIKGSRIWKGSTVAFENGLDNVAFLRTRIHTLAEFFEKGEVNEVWITFPDPRPRDKDEKLRLTSPGYLEIYKNILEGGGIVNFKTDNTELFSYTLEVLKAGTLLIKDLEYTEDLYKSQLTRYNYGIQTTFEKKYLELNTKINYLRFKFNNNS